MEPIYVWLAHLTVLQYRAVCGAIVVCGFLVVCLGPQPLLTASREGASSQGAQLAALLSERAEIQRELSHLESSMTSYHRQLADVVGSPGEDLVHVIDRASQRASVQIDGLVATGAAPTGGRSPRQTYQLTLRGQYRGVVEFVEALANESSPVVVTEVGLQAPDWMYPSQPLKARLLLHTGTLTSQGGDSPNHNID